MEELEAGLYERVVTEALAERLGDQPRDLVQTEGIDPAEAADRIALHLSRQIDQALAEVARKDRVRVGVEVTRALIDRLGDLAPVDATEALADAGKVLRAIRARQPDGRPREVNEPLTPVLDTTLLTNAEGEPTLMRQLRAEIDSADAIDLVMAFIRRSGIRPLLEPLRRHCDQGRALRVLTTTYTGSTERRALELLAHLGADVRVSYDVTSTRLHAKAWVFHRRSGFSTAYVGSSNLTHAAQAPGLEWNVRASKARNPDLLAKVAAVFDSYWEGADFKPFDADEFDHQTRTDEDAGRPLVLLSPTELALRPFQEQLLELIEVARTRGRHRNLLAAAPGTGKTVMAAVDYARLRNRLQRARLLFVAHRQELLDQAQATFCQALADPSFGERWVGGERPTHFDHVFASIQSLNATDIDPLDPDHFDVVIIDEFHHAAAASYHRLLDHVTPQELVGLTATPERSDGLPVLGWFDDRIAAELRLWDAIDQHRLVPFVYYGIHDGRDLSDLPWRRGQGYDTEHLTELYTSDDAWARLVARELVDRADDPTTMRCLGFCVSVEHARYMARRFNDHGIRAVAIWGETPEAERRAALDDLRDGRVRVIFSVDLFNEGVDVPAADTVLMLRPTESPTLFLQQLGRGLRHAPGKAFCTVLDFVGIHRREFRFDRRFRALLGGTRRDVERQMRAGFPFLPAGCHLELDEKSSEIVLQSLRDAIPSRWPAKVEELGQLARTDPAITLASYLDETGLDLEDVYDQPNPAKNRCCWSDLRDAAQLPTLPAGDDEATLRRGLGRLLHIDDNERIDAIRDLAGRPTPPAVSAMGERQRRLVHMLVADLGSEVLTSEASLEDGVDLLWRHPQVRAELGELIDQLDHRVDHLHGDLPGHPRVPLQVHARYSRIEILAALAESETTRVPAWQSGVRQAKQARADLLAFTLDKSARSFSPTTRYRDYAISPERIHWESQAATRADSETGRRYREHATRGWSIMLFARRTTDERAFWFLGPATYESHVGEKPMAITWRLDHALPGDLFTAFAAAVA